MKQSSNRFRENRLKDAQAGIQKNEQRMQETKVNFAENKFVPFFCRVMYHPTQKGE